MKPVFALTMAAALLFLFGCSEQKKETEADKKDHVLRQQIDMMNDAKAAQSALDEKTKAQDAEAAALTGH